MAARPAGPTKALMIVRVDCVAGLKQCPNQMAIAATVLAQPVQNNNDAPRLPAGTPMAIKYW